ncbi:MAG: hypothetical protein CW346_15660 [Bacillaceae bacterium]|nr:hypothetical protein [Bacillaceae bacterium]
MESAFSFLPVERSDLREKLTSAVDLCRLVYSVIMRQRRFKIIATRSGKVAGRCGAVYSLKKEGLFLRDLK